MSALAFRLQSGNADYSSGYYVGLGCGLIAAAIITIIKNLRLLKNKEDLKQREIYESDERNRMIGLKMLVLCRLCNVYSSLHCTFICRRCKRSSNEHNTRYSCRICHLLIYFQIDFKQNNVMLIPIKPELLALAFIFNKIKRGARFLRLLQVCVRKHIPQLLFILS